MIKNIILTFDYELFFGSKSGTVQNCLIIPTDKILNKLHEVGGKATFFVDYLMIKRMLSENDKTKYEAKIIIEQLQNIIKQGSRIELHIHSHWLDACYIDNIWDFSNMKNFSLHTLTDSKIKQLFLEGVNFLDNLAQEVDADYKVVAFRAGGWCIQPFNRLVSAFNESGVFIDSSVAYGIKSESQILNFDFINAPNKWRYNFSEDIIVENPNGSFVEFPISSYKFNFFEKVFNKYLKKIQASDFVKTGDGCHSGNGANITPKSFIQKIKDNSKRMFSTDGDHYWLISLKLKKSKQPVITFIAHPKDFSNNTLKTITEVSKCASFKFYNNFLQ